MRDFDVTRKGFVSSEGNSLVDRGDLPRARFTETAIILAPLDAGILYPLYVEEVMPASLIRLNISALCRMAATVVPPFTNQKIEFFGFFCPHRLNWVNWERLMGAQPDGPTQSIAFTVPQVESAAGGWAEGSMADYMGLPILTGKTESVQAFPFRTYNRIYNQFVRDQNSMEDITMTTGDAAIGIATYPLKRITWKGGYFERLLPWAQKFTPPPMFVGGLAPVIGIGVDVTNDSFGVGGINVRETGGGLKTYNPVSSFTFPPGPASMFVAGSAAADGAPQIYADLQAATSITVNAFRQSMLIQQLLERDARGGTQYIESLRNQYGANPQDFRLARPEFLGGGSVAINVTPVAQTTPVAAAGTDGVGELAGAGTGLGSINMSLAATEHGCLMVLAAIRTEPMWHQGTHPMWDLKTRFDFPFPVLAGLGEEPVLTRQLYTSSAVNDAVVLGYNPRYEWCRRAFGGIRGVLRSTAAVPIDQWHLGVEMSAPPVLGPTFLEDNPPMTRVLQAGALANGQQFKLELAIHVDRTLPLPMFGIPASLVKF